jgi:uncharacterized protein (TIGR02300 family)
MEGSRPGGGPIGFLLIWKRRIHAYIEAVDQFQTKDSLPVSKPELGTKRLCGNCGAKFYDLHHDPIVCPKCATAYVLLPPAPAAPRRPAHRWQAPVALSEAEEPEAVVAEEEARSSEALDDAEVLAEESDADEDPAALIGDRDNGEER